MVKSVIILIYAMLCASSALASGTFILRNINVTREWAARTYNPAVVKVNNHLLMVSKDNVSINLTSITDSSFKSCQIPIKPEMDYVTNKIQAKTLGNGQVVVWGVNSTLNSEKATRTVNYIVFVIDPKNCTAKRLQTVTDEVPSSWKQYWGTLLTYQNSFDIFFPTQQEPCLPCRFSDKGEKIDLNYRLRPNKDIDGDKGFFISTIRENDPSEGYNYAVYQKSGEVLSGQIDEKFQEVDVTSSVSSSIFMVDSYSSAKVYEGFCICGIKSVSSVGPFSICFVGKFENKTKNLIALLPLKLEDGKLMRTAIRVLDDGSSWIAVAHVYSEDKPTVIYVQKLKPEWDFESNTRLERHPGLASEPLEFLRITKNYFSFEMQSFTLDEEYCLVVTEIKECPLDYYKPEVEVTVKCMTADD